MFRLVAAVGILSLAAGVSAQSLGEAAAKERERRAQANRTGIPARVITSDDLAATGGSAATPAATPPAVADVVAPTPARSGGDASAAVEAEQSRQEALEAHWRQKARSRRDDESRAQMAAERAERWSDPTYAGTDRPSCPISLRNEQKRAREALWLARHNVEKLEEEARTAGALPGWVR